VLLSSLQLSLLSSYKVVGSSSLTYIYKWGSPWPLNHIICCWSHLAIPKSLFFLTVVLVKSLRLVWQKICLYQCIDCLPFLLWEAEQALALMHAALHGMNRLEHVGIICASLFSIDFNPTSEPGINMVLKGIYLIIGGIRVFFRRITIASLYFWTQWSNRYVFASELGNDSATSYSIECIIDRVQLLSINTVPIFPSSVSGNRHWEGAIAVPRIRVRIILTMQCTYISCLWLTPLAAAYTSSPFLAFESPDKGFSQ
jgi:hypothetical protein